jgi:hypothetical protein
MTPAQCRAGRALINISQARLSHVAVVPFTAVKDFELAGAARRADIDALRVALEKAGVEFIDGDRPGVRFRK